MSKWGKIKRRQNKRAKRLSKLRDKWKQGFIVQVKEPIIGTKSSIRTLKGGLPGSGK